MLYRRFSRDNVEQHITKIAFLGSYLPRKCGIATFTHDLRNAVAEEYPDVKCVVIAVNDTKAGYPYPAEVTFEIEEQDRSSYLRAADYINTSGVSLVCVQHEYGIYGGPCGSMLIAFIRALKVPVVCTLHTILQEPNDDQRKVMRAILAASAGVVTMAEIGQAMLREVYFADDQKVHLIPHGIPEMEFANTAQYKTFLKIPVDQPVILTFGLLSPNKGIEYGIRAMSRILVRVPKAKYVVLGQTHPSLIRENGDAYRHSLEHLARELGISDSIVWVNEFADLPLLKKYIAAADVYLTPYLHEQQITSGTLSYAYGMGSAVVSTPYWHAKELLAGGRGLLVPFRDSDAIGDAITDLLLNHEKRLAMKEAAFSHGRTMTWSNTAQKYFEALVRGCEIFAEQGFDRDISELGSGGSKISLPEIKLDHFHRLMDRTGMFQHANFVVPDYDHGYCSDDVSRGLHFLARYKAQSDRPWSQDLELHASTLGAFLRYAFSFSTKRFRNFMTFDRKWREDDIGSDDCQGRCLQSLGTCVRFGLMLEFTGNLFREALMTALELQSPRAWAMALLGVQAYLTRYQGDDRCIQVRKALLGELTKRFKEHATIDWYWLEEKLTYDNACISEALITCGAGCGDNEALQCGIRSLRFLWSLAYRQGLMVPVGNERWCDKRNPEMRSDYDQQPIDACGFVHACLAAHRVTGDLDWKRYARASFEWFMGRNTIGLPLYDAQSGGCFDGLHDGRANSNEGAESLLAFLSALLEMRVESENDQNAFGSSSNQNTLVVRR